MSDDPQSGPRMLTHAFYLALFVVLAVLLLAGCAPTWTEGPDTWHPEFILIRMQDDATKDCANAPVPIGRTAAGCTHLMGSGAQSYGHAIVQWQRDRIQTFCMAVHELRHALLGDQHALGDASCGTEGLPR